MEGDGEKINVIDLDGTLLTSDSLVKYTLWSLGHWRYIIPILCYSFLRVLRIIPRDVFQKNLLVRMRKTKNYKQEMKTFSTILYRDVSTSVLDFVQKHTDDHTRNVLCSASPEDYVKFLAEKLGWQHLSSTLNDNDGSFHHLYGENKITALRKRFPPQLYAYHLAISDHKSDNQLLSLFQIAYVAKHGVIKRAFTDRA